MVYNRKATAEERALIRFLYMEKRYSLREIAGKVGRSAATVMRVLKESHSALLREKGCFKDFWRGL